MPANCLVASDATTIRAAAPPKTAAGLTITSKKPPAIAPRAWLSVLAVLTPAAAAASSLGVRERTGSSADWAGLYGAEITASAATRTNNATNDEPVPARTALAAMMTARAPPMVVSTRPLGCRSRYGMLNTLPSEATKSRKPTSPTATEPCNLKASTASAVT